MNNVASTAARRRVRMSARLRQLDLFEESVNMLHPKNRVRLKSKIDLLVRKIGNITRKEIGSRVGMK